MRTIFATSYGQVPALARHPDLPLLRWLQVYPAGQMLGLLVQSGPQ
jgi:hypothetical protein